MRASHEELIETRDLVRATLRFLECYRETITPGTGAAPVAKKAADRVEEALLECMRTATDELGGILTAEHTEGAEVFEFGYLPGFLASEFTPSSPNECDPVREFLEARAS